MRLDFSFFFPCPNYVKDINPLLHFDPGCGERVGREGKDQAELLPE